MSVVKERKERDDEKTAVTQCIAEFDRAVEASEHSLAETEEKATRLHRKLRRRTSVENLAAVVESLRPVAATSE